MLNKVSELPPQPREEFRNLSITERLSMMGMTACFVSFHRMKDGRVYIGPRTDCLLDEAHQVDAAIRKLISEDEYNPK
jgi:hypothetical protein